jgi:hypothetical protein
MNLIEPPKSKVFLWVAKHRKAVADYFKAVFQLSKLQAVLTYKGKSYPTVVTYTGRNAELKMSLDMITPAAASTAATPYALNTINASSAATDADLAARVADALVAASPGDNIAGLSAARITNGLSIANTDAVNFITNVSCGMDVVAGNVTLTYSVTFDASCSFTVIFGIADRDYTVIATDTANFSSVASGSGSLVVNAPADGFYIFGVQASQTPGPGSPTSQTFTGSLTSPGAVASNVVGLWTDGSNIGLVPAIP